MFDKFSSGFALSDQILIAKAHEYINLTGFRWLRGGYDHDGQTRAHHKYLEKKNSGFMRVESQLIRPSIVDNAIGEKAHSHD